MIDYNDNNNIIIIKNIDNINNDGDGDNDEIDTNNDDYRFLAYFRNLGILAKKGFLLFGHGVSSARPLAYASEFGESLRPIAPKWFVRGMYGLSIGYVISDIGIKIHEIKDQGTETILMKAGELTLWHTSASLVLPAVCIHTIVKSSTKLLDIVKHMVEKRGMKLPKHAKFAPVILGLSSIPFIIHPIDEITDFGMGKLKKFFKSQI